MEFIPVDPELERVWELLSPEARQSRLEQAVLRRKTVESMLARPPGNSEWAAAARIVPWAELTAIRRAGHPGPLVQELVIQHDTGVEAQKHVTRIALPRRIKRCQRQS